MKTLLLALAITALVAGGRAATARELAVPEGVRPHLVIRDPHEIVAWVAFDTATVRERLPGELRFVTIGELAAGGVGWAAEQLAAHPSAPPYINASVALGAAFLLVMNILAAAQRYRP